MVIMKATAPLLLLGAMLSVPFVVANDGHQEHIRNGNEQDAPFLTNRKDNYIPRSTANPGIPKEGSKPKPVGKRSNGKRGRKKKKKPKGGNNGPLAVLILTLRNIVDPLGMIEPNSDTSLDLDGDGVVTFLDVATLLEDLVGNNTESDLVPGGNMTAFVLNDFSSAERRLINTSTQKEDMVRKLVTGSQTYNSYTRGIGPGAVGPPRSYGQPDFVFDPNEDPSWIDYFLYAATLDVAGLTATSVITTAVISRNVFATLGAAALLLAIQEFAQEFFIGQEEGIEGFRHYLGNSGTNITVDYEKAIREDTGIANAYNLEVLEALDAARALRANDQEVSFEFHKATEARSVASQSVNWRGALGRHFLWTEGAVTYNSGPCNLEVTLEVFVEDLYDFNKDDPGISLPARIASNIFGRFTVLGWASPFFSKATFTTTETLDLECCIDDDCGDATKFDCKCNLCEEQCPATRTSGGQGFTVFSVDLKKTNGTFPASYQMYTIPDKLEILYEGAVIFTTGGLVSGSRSLSITYGSSTSTSTSVVVKIDAPNSGTAWDVVVGCPP